jgi:ABC-type transport system substrate-binding protein
MSNIFNYYKNVIARRALVLSDEATSSHQEIASGERTSPSQRHKHVNVLLILILVLSLVFSASTKKASALQVDIPLDKAIVYNGGESTNLRDYDPATTYSSGNKLIFSGLVSFDPHLNLTPDLAETWDISDDGTVYTFHLRENARFHDGRFVTAKDVIYSWERAASPQIKSDTVLT